MDIFVSTHRRNVELLVLPSPPSPAHGLGEDEDWVVGEGPEEHERLAEFERACDQIATDTFREYGEPELAELWRHDRAEFDRRCEAGRRHFQGPLPVARAAFPARVSETTFALLPYDGVRER